MKKTIIRILVSIPTILIFMYYTPLLSVFIIIFRCILYFDDKKKLEVFPLILLILGIVIYIPKIISLFVNLFNNSKKLIILNDILNSETYIALLKMGKRLIIVSIALLIILTLFSFIFKKILIIFRNCIQRQEQIDQKISQTNDLIMKEKREKSKNTFVVYCPYCGADNIITNNYGICKYCRRKIVKKQ